MASSDTPRLVKYESFFSKTSTPTRHYVQDTEGSDSDWTDYDKRDSDGTDSEDADKGGEALRVEGSKETRVADRTGR